MVSYTDRYIILSKLPYLTLQHIDWAANPSRSTVEDMCVNHGCFYVFVTQEFLDRSNIITAFQ